MSEKIMNISTKKISTFFALILSFCALISIMMVSFARNDKHIYIYQDGNETSGYKITSINIGETSYPLENFENNNAKLIDNLLVVQDKDYVFEITTSTINNVSIIFSPNKDSNDVKVKEISDYQTLDTNINLNSSNSDYEGYYSIITIKEILSYCISNMQLLDFALYFVIYITIFLILYFCFRYVFKFIDELNESKTIFRIFLFLISCFIVMLSSIYILLELFNIFVLLPIFLILFYIFKRYKNLFKKIENIFLVFGTAFGLMFIFILPPFHVPDEGAHFLKTYRLSYFNSSNLDVYDKGTGNASMDVPKNVDGILDEYMIDIHSTSYVLSAKSYFANFSNKFNEHEIARYNVFFGNTETINPFCYIFSTLSMAMCRFLNSSVLFSTLLGRFFNFSFFIVCGYLSLKKIPKFKYALFVVMMLPICIQQAAAFNQDTMTNSLLFLIFSNIIYLMFDGDKQIKFSDTYLLSILGVCLSFCKFGYFPIFFLLFLIPKNRFKNIRSRLFIFATIVLPNLILTAFNLVFFSGSATTYEFYQVSDVIHAPIYFIKIYLRTFLERFQSDILGNLINCFGWSTKNGKNCLVFIAQSIVLIFYLIACNDENSDKKITLKFRIFCFLIFFLISGLIYSALLTGCTYKGWLTIHGLQARYFIPTVLLLLCTISNDKIKLNVKERCNFYFYGYLIVYVITFITIISGYYI